MITRAEEKNFIEVMYIYKACVSEMNREGLFNWNTAYPDHKDVLEDIRKGDIFILQENNVTIAVVCLNEDQPAEYEDLTWNYEPPYLVVHRLAVHPACRNMNAGSRLMEFAERYAAEKGYRAVRLDAIMVNPSAMRLYGKIGYEEVGTVHFSYQKDRFMCMEKSVTSSQK
jgi:ribosomal protein S18 acetylase RimI-like enzyme